MKAPRDEIGTSEIENKILRLLDKSINNYIFSKFLHKRGNSGKTKSYKVAIIFRFGYNKAFICRLLCTSTGECE